MPISRDGFSYIFDDGRSIELPGAHSATPLIVHAHGSEPTGWIERGREPYLMASREISVFVYDKRGKPMLRANTLG